MKTGKILDQDDGAFGFEYDDTRGTKNMMRLDAFTYEGAIREAKSYLGINKQNYDDSGSEWEIE